MDEASAGEKLDAGATLVQLYTGLIYRGLPLIDEILDGFSEALAESRATSISALVGVGAKDWAMGSGPPA